MGVHLHVSEQPRRGGQSVPREGKVELVGHLLLVPHLMLHRRTAKRANQHSLMSHKPFCSLSAAFTYKDWAGCPRVAFPLISVHAFALVALAWPSRALACDRPK